MATQKGYLYVLQEAINIARTNGKKVMVINKYKGPIPSVVEVSGVEKL